VLPGARVARLDLLGTQPLADAEVLLAQVDGGAHRQAELLRRRRGGLLRAQQVAAGDVVDGLAGQAQAEPARLLVAGVVEGNVDVALEAQLAVPVGLAVADEDEVGGHGTACIVHRPRRHGWRCSASSRASGNRVTASRTRSMPRWSPRPSTRMPLRRMTAYSDRWPSVA